MQTKRTGPITDVIKNLGVNNTEIQSLNHSQNINPQVKAVVFKTVRRKFSASDKLKLIKTFDACVNSDERGIFLRKEGLYYSNITKWKRELSDKNVTHANSKAYKSMLEQNKLQRENARLKKKLAQAEAIIDLQKKVSELLSLDTPDHEASETKS